MALDNCLKPLTCNRCPKCKSNEVYAGTDISFKRGAYDSNSIPISFWSAAALDNYVCTQCGDVEGYVGDPDKLLGIAANWTGVGRK
jgi:hypothetical protein